MKITVVAESDCDCKIIKNHNSLLLTGVSDHPGSDYNCKGVEYNLRAMFYNSFIDAKDIPHSGITEEVKLCPFTFLACLYCMWICVFSVNMSFALAHCSVRNLTRSLATVLNF